MASVHDVAAYILKKHGPMTTMKLQKLVYYSQAWSLVWNERRLFKARIEAWANGPVCRDLYYQHKGRFQIREWPQGDPEAVSAADRRTIDSVLKYYGDKTSQWLSDLTHAEAPWRDARGQLSDDEHSGEEITEAAMAEYYGGLLRKKS